MKSSANRALLAAVASMALFAGAPVMPASTTSASSQPRSGDQKVPINKSKSFQASGAARQTGQWFMMVSDAGHSRSDKSVGYIESEGGTSCQSFPKLKMLGSETAQ